jgi:hypothetical protein
MEKRNWDKVSEDLGWGFILIALGVYFLLVQLDVVPPGWTRGWWAWFVVGAGVVTLATARSAKRVGEGVTTVLIGLWLWVAASRSFGLNWGTSWPLALLAIGGGMLARTLAGLFLPDQLKPGAAKEGRGDA